MELVKNKASGKYFIVLDYAGDNYLLLITPEGKIKRLERHLFGSLVVTDHKDLWQHNHLTKDQLDKYWYSRENLDY